MKKKYRELLDKLYKNDDASLQKMGRPRLQFPKLKVPTRLDQEIRPIATPRQKKMHAAVATNRLYRDFFEEKNIEPSKRKLYDSKKESTRRSVAGKYSAGTMGNVLTSDSSKWALGAALVGKEYSKYDPATKQISSERQGQKQQQFEQEYGEWKKKLDSLPRGSTEYWNTLAGKPKPPRKTTAKIDTKKLSPEAQIERGRAQDVITEHEAAHLAFHHIRTNHPEKYNDIMDHLLESFHPEVLSALVQSTRERYNSNSPHFKEEVINHARDILSSKKMRDSFLRDVSRNPKAIKFLKQKHNLPEEASAYVPSILKDIKSGWNEVAKRSKKITPNFVKKSLGKSAKYPKDDMRGITTRKLKELSENNNPFYNPDTGLELVPEHAEAELARRYDKKGEKELARYKKGLKPSTKPPENPEDWFGKNSLQKSAKEYKAMLGGDVSQHQEAFDTAKKMPNSNWGQWVIRNYKQNPEKFKQIKQHLEHFAGSQHIPDIAKIRFDREHDFDSGLNKLKDAEKSYNKRLKQSTNIVKPTATTRKILDLGNGMAWYSLGSSSCGAEGKAMGHCGNVPSKQPYHDVLSLRTVHNIDGEEYHEPHLTFINDTRYNNLGEMKGRGNEKPSKKYHPAIVKLLNQGYFPEGGGYAPESNFNLSDLSEEHAKNLTYGPLIDGESLAQSDHFNSSSIRINLAENPNLHPSLQERLANDEDLEVRHSLASNPNLHLSSQEKLANDKHENVRYVLAQNTDIHPSLHEKLAGDEDSGVRRAIARNPNLHPSLQEKLAGDGNDDVRREIAENLNLHPSLHEKLAGDGNDDVRRAIARNPNLHPSLHEKLAGDNDLYVRRAIAENPNLHPSLHEKLAEDEDPDVRREIARNPNLHPSVHEKLAGDEDSDVLRAIARNPNLHPSVHEKLAGDNDWAVRRAIAENPNLHPSVHEKLAGDNSWEVRREIARNPNLHPSVHEKLAGDEDSDVRQAIAQNPNYIGNIKKSEQQYSFIKKSLPSAPKVNLNPEHGKIVADAYENMKHDPNHPHVKAAYNALINETKQQFKDMINNGFKVSALKPNQENPYPTSKHLHADIKQNKHMWFFPTEQGYGEANEAPKDHPLLQPTEFHLDGKPLLANDLFRIVHDYRVIT